MTLELGSLPWYEMVARTIDAIYEEELHRPSDIVGAASWLFHAREQGNDSDWIRARIRESPEWIALHTTPPPPVVQPLPDVKSRDEICGVQLTFQGLVVPTTQYGALPWFDAALFSLGVGDRQAVYAMKRMAGDTHAIIEYDSNPGSIYDEPGNPYQQMNGAAFELHPDAFLAAIREVLLEGFTPMIFMGGDDGEKGFAVATQQLPGLIAVLRGAERDFVQDVLISPGWDGVFYGYTPEHVVAFGRQFRALAPDGHLAIEHQPGRIPTGEGGGDWVRGANRMEHFDVLLSEFNLVHADEMWQVAGRTLGPAYRRPADEPAGDDPSPPWYLRDGTARGPYFVCAFEFTEYTWVRNQISAADVATQRAYLRAAGYTFTG